jgi:hypothetical protein
MLLYSFVEQFRISTKIKMVFFFFYPCTSQIIWLVYMQIKKEIARDHTKSVSQRCTDVKGVFFSLYLHSLKLVADDSIIIWFFSWPSSKYFCLSWKRRNFFLFFLRERDRKSRMQMNISLSLSATCVNKEFNLNKKEQFKSNASSRRNK